MIVVTGARGFIGSAVCAALRARGDRVVTVGRGPDANVAWPPGEAEFDTAALTVLAGARAVVHLAGESIGVRWTEARKREIVRSRVVNTGRLARAAATVIPTPAAFLSASGVGYYGSRGDEWLDESSSTGTDFLSEVTRLWEGASEPAREAGMRVVCMRFGVVLGPGGGMLAKLRLPFSLGLGGRLGSGQQWLSWISLNDLVRVVLRLIDHSGIEGAVNVASATPVRNEEFTATLGRVLRRPAVLPVPAFALRAMFGEMADGTALASQRVRPARLQAAGFVFDQPTIDDALCAALKSPGR